MKTNTTLGVLFFALTITATITSCGSGEKKEETNADTLATTTEIPADQPAGSTESFKDFDWSTVPQSNAEIGAFPFLTAPSGFIITDKGRSNESKTGYSEMKDFNKLIMFTGASFYNAEGKVAKLVFKMKEREGDWNQYSFDSSVDKYMQSIDAKLLGKLKVTQAQKEFLNKEDDMSIYNHIVGDPYNDPVRMYALNHSKGKIMFQVYSNSASGEVGVVELAAFEQTIKAPTAVQMKKDIDANGKAILNINFDIDKSTLQPEGQKVLDEILSLMKGNADLKIAIEGHTDNAGSGDHNKKLSTDRANTILKFLTSNGISASRLTAAGFGAERPLVANDSEANMAKNRRVELVKE
ncbi:OmpA family protein [Pedobacter psychroterrae]|uniref:OmpA family protein n=1 Tax=Pedobacter psychroterrae TaxID=2530453 RepID=A0A4R0NWB5_9SPHI|nr:OmpA family protein [Pedobacter psychroterrae]TCD03885.1 OmpA family protein [Pedobacter psychroterrae]